MSLYPNQGDREQGIRRRKREWCSSHSDMLLFLAHGAHGPLVLYFPLIQEQRQHVNDVYETM